jgi:hypothetical protein
MILERDISSNPHAPEVNRTKSSMHLGFTLIFYFKFPVILMHEAGYSHLKLKMPEYIKGFVRFPSSLMEGFV